MIATRLKLFLSDIISPTQSVFVPGRLITDNVLIAYESLHTIKQKKIGKEGWCAVKFGMHKAYDRVEWVFREAILLKLGFHANWVNMVMLCVSSVEYRVRYNSTETEAFKPSRGLRQGDPLSPYLFLLCTEGLTALLSRAENNGDLVGVKVCRDAPAVSNLLFADDSLILMKANATNAACLKSILDLYCSAFGQLVSVEKSSIFFSPSTDVNVKAHVCSILDIMTEALNDKYLGLPATLGIDKSDSFQYLIVRLVMRLSGWKEKCLSTGGKEVLIKSVAQAIPTYVLSVFKIPKSKGITAAISRFWWGDDATHKRMHWFALWKMCIPKKRLNGL